MESHTEDCNQCIDINIKYSFFMNDTRLLMIMIWKRAPTFDICRNSLSYLSIFGIDSFEDYHFSFSDMKSYIFSTLESTAVYLLEAGTVQTLPIFALIFMVFS